MKITDVCERETAKYVALFFFLACTDKEKQAASLGRPGFGSGPTAHCRPRRRRSVYRVTQHLLSSTRRPSLETLEAPPHRAVPTESGQMKEERESPTPSSELNSSRTSVPPPQHQPINLNNTPNSHLNQNQLLEVLYDLFGLWLIFMKYQDVSPQKKFAKFKMIFYIYALTIIWFFITVIHK